jgi:hypothetical protein
VVKLPFKSLLEHGELDVAIVQIFADEARPTDGCCFAKTCIGSRPASCR